MLMTQLKMGYNNLLAKLKESLIDISEEVKIH